jgi:hypothetical protein
MAQFIVKIVMQFGAKDENEAVTKMIKKLDISPFAKRLPFEVKRADGTEEKTIYVNFYTKKSESI